MTANKQPDPRADVDVPQQEGSTAPSLGEGEEASAEALAAARAEALEYRDRFLRAKAETDNVRRRSEQDIANVRKFALEGFAGEVLGVRDNLERALSVDMSRDDVVAKVLEGLNLTLAQLDGILEKFGLVMVDPQGERFDPERHQAMTTADSSDVPPGHVVSVMQKGYLLNGRLLRPALVIVARDPESS